MTEILIMLSVLVLIVTTHFLVHRFAHQIHNKFEGDTKKIRIVGFAMFMSIAAVYFLLALVLIVTTQ